jgi:electron transfer flavoprotein beta subunit
MLVCVKQVPVSDEAKIDTESGNLIRSSQEGKINPYDLYAIELALSLQNMFGGTTTAISMGPPGAELALRECIAMGVSDAILLSDRKFAGSDTLATTYILSQAIRQYVPDYDFIFCGKHAVDSDTAIVGPGLAERLDIPCVSSVSEIERSLDSKTIACTRRLPNGIQKVRCSYPALVTITDGGKTPRYIDIRNILQASEAYIPCFDADTLKCEDGKIGKTGSPTSVASLFEVKRETHTRILSGDHNSNIKSLLQLISASNSWVE